jgi:hypothetical protein
LLDQVRLEEEARRRREEVRLYREEERRQEGRRVTEQERRQVFLFVFKLNAHIEGFLLVIQICPK